MAHELNEFKIQFVEPGYKAKFFVSRIEKGPAKELLRNSRLNGETTVLVLHCESYEGHYARLVYVLPRSGVITPRNKLFQFAKWYGKTIKVGMELWMQFNEKGRWELIPPQEEKKAEVEVKEVPIGTQEGAGAEEPKQEESKKEALQEFSGEALYVLSSIQHTGIASYSELKKNTKLPDNKLRRALAELIGKGKIVRIQKNGRTYYRAR